MNFVFNIAKFYQEKTKKQSLNQLVRANERLVIKRPLVTRYHVEDLKFSVSETPKGVQCSLYQVAFKSIQNFMNKFQLLRQNTIFLLKNLSFPAF